jgi:DNA-binding GntR family transcriptional regulator
MSKNVTIPIYKKVQEELKNKIDSGTYKIGELIPSENDLCKTYSTTRPTIRLALSELMRMGYIVTQHGKGSTVSEPKNGLGILSLKGATAGVGRKNLKTEILHNPEKINWPGDFSYGLSATEIDSGAIYFSRLRYVNGLPVLYELTYISNINLPRFTVHNLEKNSLFDTLREFYQVEIKEGEQKIWAIEANKDLAKLLNIGFKKPVLHMKRKLMTNIKDLHIYSFLYCNTEEFFIQDYF